MTVFILDQSTIEVAPESDMGRYLLDNFLKYVRTAQEFKIRVPCGTSALVLTCRATRFDIDGINQ